MFTFDSLDLPVVAAPMAGGPSTPDLVIDAARAGGWGVLAGANKTVGALADEVARVRDADVAAGVNLFIPGPQSSDAEALASLRAKMTPIAEKFDVELAEPVWDDDGYPDKIEWLTEHPVDVVTFTFGLPPADEIAALHDAGSALGAMVTTPDDAQKAAARGMDFLVLQGPQAGGHQSTFDLDAEPVDTDLLTLLTDARAVTQLPLLAAGGIATPDDVRAVIDAGAVAAQIGTAYLRSSSSGASATHRAALASPEFTTTMLTRAYSGRYARGLANEFASMLDGVSPAAYPEVHRMLGPLRKAAALAGDAQWTHLWAGTGWRRSAEAMPVGLAEADAGVITRWLGGAEV